MGPPSPLGGIPGPGRGETPARAAPAARPAPCLGARFRLPAPGGLWAKREGNELPLPGGSDENMLADCFICGVSETF